jgi:hypothetical protein
VDLGLDQSYLSEEIMQYKTPQGPSLWAKAATPTPNYQNMQPPFQ